MRIRESYRLTADTRNPHPGHVAPSPRPPQPYPVLPGTAYGANYTPNKWRKHNGSAISWKLPLRGNPILPGKIRLRPQTPHRCPPYSEALFFFLVGLVGRVPVRPPCEAVRGFEVDFQHQHFGVRRRAFAFLAHSTILLFKRSVADSRARDQPQGVRGTMPANSPASRHGGGHGGVRGARWWQRWPTQIEILVKVVVSEENDDNENENVSNDHAMDDNSGDQRDRVHGHGRRSPSQHTRRQATRCHGRDRQEWSVNTPTQEQDCRVAYGAQ
ncbi:hypothetical protein TIFTF001_027159 [Ficus carica]|uniref:Uncharacterized protein n=1 Tax=Ficus carica TaxID=3494 RepID=A0AA88IZW3_FICCA|nr:hypothetical protein TIFTF001_027159 [Ficus carica]